MSDEIVRETISVTRTQITDEDKAVSEAYNAVVIKALKVADRLLRFGTPETKLRIAVAAMSSASRLAAIDSKSVTEEHRIAFDSLLTKMTQIPEIQHVVTEKEFIDVEPTALPGRTDDKDDIVRDAKIQLGLYRPGPDDR